jgi:hypothetical protein
MDLSGMPSPFHVVGSAIVVLRQLDICGSAWRKHVILIASMIIELARTSSMFCARDHQQAWQI